MVKIQITGQNGHTTLELEPQEALDRIKQEVGQGKWAYINGQFAKADTISLSDLGSADSIMLVSSLLGG